MFRASLSGQIRQTKLPKWKPLLPVFEAVMNSFQAIQERGAPGTIIVNVVPAQSLGLDEVERVERVVVMDDGIGFTDENMDSFNTAFSEYKYSRGGKGVGRFLWLKAFEQVEVDSVFDAGDQEGLLRRRFTFDTAYDPDQVMPSAAPEARIGTSVELRGFQEPFRNDVPLDLPLIAQRMCEHFILLLMQPDCPAIELRSGREKISLNQFFETGFTQSASRTVVRVRDHEFTVNGFRLNQPRAFRHRLIYCADERAVLSENLEDHIPNLSGRLTDENGESFIYLAVVTGRFLNAHVNQERTAFDIDDDTDAEAAQGTLLVPDLKRSEIRNACMEVIKADLEGVLAEINTGKLDRIKNYVATDAPHYRILLKRADEFIDRIPPSGTKTDLELALHRELHQREVELKKEGRVIVEAAKLDNYEAYRDKLAKYLENNNELGVAALAQYVAHRKIVLDLFERALSSPDGAGRYPLERVLHQIIFPMRSSSDDTLYAQQNLWLLDERLNSHGVIHSDRQLRSIEGLESDSALRPDLIAFDQEYLLGEGQPLTSLTVVEFKRPMRDDYTDEQNPLDQVFEVIEKVRSGTRKDSNGRPIAVASQTIPATCYVVCDLTPKLRRILKHRDAIVMPDGQGFYGYSRNYNTYFEVLDYGKVLRDAQRRNATLFDKLKLA